MDERAGTGEAPRTMRFDELSEGMSATYIRTVTEDDVATFAAVSGDDNPVHLDDEFAARSPFGGRIAHGMLTASYISTVIGTRLPGAGTVYLSQSLRFTAPVRIGDRVETRVTITGLKADKNRVELETVCRVGSRVVLSGEALVMVPAPAGN